MARPGIAVSVVIATYMREDQLVQSIRSLMLEKFPHELIVVDQTPTHKLETEAFLASLPVNWCRWYRIQPPSLPAARNFGLARARAPVVLFLDDDVIVEPGLLHAHWRLYRDDPNVAAVAGRVRVDGERQSTQLYQLGRLGGARGGFDFPRTATVQTVRGCNMSFHTARLREVGGFDSRFIGNAIREETDVCFRLRAAGFGIRYVPEAAVVHMEAPEGGCTEGLPLSEVPAFYRNELLFFLKHGSRALLIPFLLLKFRHHVLRRDALRAGRIWRRSRAFAEGCVDGVRAYRSTASTTSRSP